MQGQGLGSAIGVRHPVIAIIDLGQHNKAVTRCRHEAGGMGMIGMINIYIVRGATTDHVLIVAPPPMCECESLTGYELRF